MENSAKKNTFTNLTGAKTHWFLSPDKFGSSNTTPNKRLNGLDSKILEDSTVAKTEGEALSTDFQIAEKEKEIKGIKEKIKIYDSIGNRQDAFGLRIKKQRLEQELKELYTQNTDKASVATISKDLEEPIKYSSKEKFPVINAVKKFIKRHILARISKKFKSLVALGDSLDTLASINKNVDELLSMKTPYGETAQNYEKLTEYLYKAHKIRAQINRSIKK